MFFGWRRGEKMSKMILYLFVVIAIISSSSLAHSSERLSFVGADGLQESFTYVKRLSDAKINIFGLEQLRWNFIEPSPPRKKGEHNYDWSKVDQVIKKIESVKGRAFITIVCSSRWATKQKTGSRVASPPEDSHWNDYRDFVQSLVERYDNDGFMDMPGLKYAHLYYQIEDEAENPSSWSGSKEEYLKLLRTAREGAKKANPDVNIFTFSPNFGDFFDHLTPAEIQEKLRMLDHSESKSPNRAEDLRKQKGSKKTRKVSFVKTVLEAQDAYDFISIQYNYHYTGLPGIISVIRKFSSKPIWVADSASATLLGRHQKVAEEYAKDKYPYLNEGEIGNILSDSGSHKHREIKEWWEAEKASASFKKIVTAASLGVEHIFMQFILDTTSKPLKGDETGINPWNFAGLLEKNGDPRPVVNTIKLFHEKLGGFSKVDDLTKKEGPPSEWIMHYRFTTNGKTLDVLWTDGDEKKYSLSRKGRLSVIHIVEKKEGKTQVEFLGQGELKVGRSPIIVMEE